LTVTISLVIIIALVSYFFAKQLHQYRLGLYALATIAVFVEHEQGNYLTYGFVALAFFLVVMYTGALQRGKLRKQLAMVRAEWAVVGSLLLIPHFLVFTEFVLDELGLWQAPLNYWLGVIAGLMIVPLAITSLRIVRKQLRYPQWKHLHRMSYLLYALVALHLIVLGNQRLPFYLILFGTYLVMRLFTWWEQHNLRINTRKSNQKRVG